MRVPRKRTIGENGYRFNAGKDRLAAAGFVHAVSITGLCKAVPLLLFCVLAAVFVFHETESWSLSQRMPALRTAIAAFVLRSEGRFFHGLVINAARIAAFIAS